MILNVLIVIACQDILVFLMFKIYATCIYLKTTSNNGSLLISKCRLAPKRTMTLPRLELMACLICSRLLKNVISELNISINVIKAYSDSKAAFCWIKGINRTYEQFVESRVTAIRELVPPDNWHHVPGKHNLADLATKPFVISKCQANFH